MLSSLQGSKTVWYKSSKSAGSAQNCGTGTLYTKQLRQIITFYVTFKAKNGHLGLNLTKKEKV